MGILEAEPFSEKLDISVSYQEIDILKLIDRIQQRYVEIRERSPDKGFIVVITQEEWRALQYYFIHPDYYNVRVPIQRLYLHNKLKSAPYLGLVIFGMQVIGSDLVGELSPFII